MGTEKFIAFKEDGTAYRLKGRILRFLDNEPVSEADKTNIRSTLSVPASAEGLTPSNNLSDVSSAATSRTNLGVNGIDEDAQAYALKTTAPALYFNGTSSLVTVADDDKLSFTDGVDDLPFSVSVCVRFFELGDAGGIIGKQDNTARGEWGLMLTSSGYFSFRCWTAGNLSNYINVNTTGPFNPGQWYHVLGTYDGSGNASGLKLYVNAVDESDTPTEVGTYAGMSNTSSPVWVGAQQNQGFFQGSIRDVKIFNRELTATEIAELARGNDLGFSEEWAGAHGGLYTSDFTSDSTDSWTPVRATLDATATVGGDSDNVKLICDATASNTHYMYYTLGVGVGIGKRYRVEFDYYIPSGQTAVDSLAFYVGSSSTKHGITSPTTDAWTRYSVEAIHTGTNLQLQFTLNDGGANSFNGVSGEYVAFRNITYTEIGTLADFRAEDYNESASKLLDRSSNNFVGVGTSVTLTGNQRHISADTIDLKNLPTSSAGLSAGEVWSNGGVLTVV